MLFNLHSFLPIIYDELKLQKVVIFCLNVFTKNRVLFQNHNGITM